MNYAQATKDGFKTLRESFERGYISRKVDIDLQPVCFDRFENPYVQIPNLKSTRYFIRRYLTK